MTDNTNPRSWAIKRPYTDHVDVRSAIVNDACPTHFDPEDTRCDTDNPGRFDCPEWWCGRAFRPQEMVAHLEWDHGFTELEARRAVEKHVES